MAQSARSVPRSYTEFEGLSRDRDKIFIGRGDGTQTTSRYGNFSIDDLEYWYNNREYLIAFEYLTRGKVAFVSFSYSLDLDELWIDQVQVC